MKKTLSINKDNCPKNHRCPAVNIFPVGVLSQVGYNAPEIDCSKCISCGKCSNFCTKKVLQLV